MTRRAIFKRNLDALMKAHGIKQQRDLAHALNIPYTSVNQWFSRGTVPRDEHLVSLCAFFKISIGSLFDPQLDASDYEKVSITEAAFSVGIMPTGFVAATVNEDRPPGYGADTEASALAEMVMDIYQAGTEDQKAAVYGHIRRIHDKLKKG